MFDSEWILLSNVKQSNSYQMLALSFVFYLYEVLMMNETLKNIEWLRTEVKGWLIKRKYQLTWIINSWANKQIDVKSNSLKKKEYIILS